MLGKISSSKYKIRKIHTDGYIREKESNYKSIIYCAAMLTDLNAEKDVLNFAVKEKIKCAFNFVITLKNTF